MKKPTSVLLELQRIMESHAPVLREKLHELLRQSYGHVVSVHVLVAASMALLLSIVLYFLSPVLEDDYHIYRQYLPWIYYMDWSHYDSFIVDHVLVFSSISLPMGWLFLFHIANSSISSRIDVALLVLRVVCCATVCFSLTVILTEFLSRRVMIALISLAYGSLGLVYSWSVPVWRWYLDEASAKGLVAFLPESLQELLLRTSLLEWLTDTSLMDQLRPFLPFFLPLSKAEQNRVLEQLPVEKQIMLTRPGMVALLPPTVQKVLLPTPSHDVAELTTLAVAGSTSGGGISGSMAIPASASAGFDFHRTTNNSSSDLRSQGVAEDVVGEILSKRVVGGCLELVKVPSSVTLHRTMTVSTAVFAMQLYASKGSRRMLVSLLQFAVASSLVSIASMAFVVRVVQLLTQSGTSHHHHHSTKLLRMFRQYLLRAWTPTAGQLANGSSASNVAPATATSKKLQSAATSVSAVVAVLYVLRRLRR